MNSSVSLSIIYVQLMPVLTLNNALKAGVMDDFSHILVFWEGLDLELQLF